MVNPLNDPVFLLIAGFLLALIFFFYLLIRRSMAGFKEGMRGEK